MRALNKLYLLTILLIIPVQLINAQTKKSEVLVVVSGNQKTPNVVITRFSNFVKGKLLELNNVELVNDNEDYKVNIMMFQNRTKEGESLGYVISTTFLKPYECKGYRSFEYLTSILSTAKESELDSTAQNIVSAFDQDVLKVP